MAKPSIYEKSYTMKVGDDQLGVIIANKIKENGLNGVFDHNSINNIKEKLKSEFRKMKNARSVEMIPEGQYDQSSVNAFPYEENDTVDPVPDATLDIAPAMEAGSEPTDVAYTPSMYTPELPDVLKDKAPAKLVVMELNDIIENGENLANKPFRTLDDIDMETSMKSLWNSEGVTKAEVYQIKFERIGDMEFNYANGISTYTPSPSPMESSSDPNAYKDNPYSEKNPELSIDETPTKQDIETYVRTSIDIEDVVRKTVMDLMAKAHEEQMNDDAKTDMGLAPIEDPSV